MDSRISDCKFSPRNFHSENFTGLYLLRHLCKLFPMDDLQNHIFNVVVQNLHTLKALMVLKFFVEYLS